MKSCIKTIAFMAIAGMAFASCSHLQDGSDYTPVDYVNPYMGNVSHLLVPTFPTIHLPNSLLRVYPQRADYTSEHLAGLPVIVTHHREKSAFNISPTTQPPTGPVTRYNYDNEEIHPYYYTVELNDNRMKAEYAPSHQSALYALHFVDSNNAYVSLSTPNGHLTADGNHVSGWQQLDSKTKIYLYLESEQTPETSAVTPCGDGEYVVWHYSPSVKDINLRYGVSLISEEQAKKNLNREIHDYDLHALAEQGREKWNKALGVISIEERTRKKRYSTLRCTARLNVRYA